MISKNPQEFRQKSIDGGTCKMVQTQKSRPELQNNSHSSPDPAVPKKTFCPINYHDETQKESRQPQNNQQAPPRTPPSRPTPQGQDNTFHPSTFLKHNRPDAKDHQKSMTEGFDVSYFAKETPNTDFGSTLEDALLSMSEALTPRNQAGNLLPIAYENHVQEAMLPHFEPNDNGYTAPIISAEEFGSGQTPKQITYKPGLVIGRKDTNGDLQYQEIFSDPVLNLTPEQRKALELGLQMLQKQEDKQSSAEESSFSRNNSFDAVIDSPQDGFLFFKSTRGLIQLTNFRVTAKEARTILGKKEGEGSRIEYLLEVQCCGTTRTIMLAPHELDNAVKLIQTELPSCIVLPGVQKVHIYISNYIRQQLQRLMKTLHIQRTGFHRIHNTWYFVHDHATPPDPNTVFDTGRYIPNCPSVSDAQACRDSLSWLEISPRDDLVIPMYLLCFLSIMFKLFQEAGYTVRFLTAITGRSGSLKTSTTMACYRMYNDDTLIPKASYKDTETALEQKMASANGAVLVIDDFHPEATGDRSQNQRGKLECVLRFIGDNITKSRSNTKLGRAIEFRPSGCIVTTAEDLSGSQSALLRCLILRIGLGDIDGKKLRRFQENPLLMSSQMHRFAAWAGKHGDEIIEMLRRNFPRSTFEGTVSELRLVDTGATLLATAQIFTAYAQSVGAMDNIEAQQFVERCTKAITTAIVASEAMSKDANPVVMYIEAFNTLVERGEVKLAANMSIYSAEYHDGYLDGASAWVDGKAIYAKVRHYYSKLNTSFPLSESQVAVHMGDLGIFAISFETRYGTQKKLYSKRSSLPSRKRMTVIDIDRAQAYLEENANN